MNKIGLALIGLGVLLFAASFLGLITNMALIHAGILGFPMSPIVPLLMLASVWCGVIGIFVTWAHHIKTEGTK